jgi:hypothetical protein
MVSAGDKDFDWLRKISPFTIPNPRLANVSRQGFLLAKENQAVYDSKPTGHGSPVLSKISGTAAHSESDVTRNLQSFNVIRQIQ